MYIATNKDNLNWAKLANQSTQPKNKKDHFDQDVTFLQKLYSE